MDYKMDTAGITSGTIVVTTFRNASLYTDYKTDTAGITSGKKRLLTLDFELDAAIHEANCLPPEQQPVKSGFTQLR